jgi:Tol biopolymer transport system component
VRRRFTHAPFLGAAVLAAAMVACASEPGEAPERAILLYTAYVDGNADIFRRSGVGGTPERLTQDPAQDHWAAWSPRAERIVFQTLRDGNREVYVMDRDGSHPTNLTRHPEDDLLPAWSPDGSRILFFSTRGQPRGPEGEYMGNLWVMNQDGSSPRRLTRTALTSSFSGSWSPDGRSILFTRDWEGTLFLHLLDVASGEETRLTHGPESLMGGRLSPDGSRLVASMQVGDESRIVVMDPDGASLRTLTSGAAHYYPTWSPDGRWIVFTGAPLGSTDHDIHAIPADGGAPVPLIATSADERFGTWIASAEDGRR